MKSKHVIISGAGIGGASLAMHLEKLGIKYTLLERGDELREKGTGIGIQKNAIDVLDGFGISDYIKAEIEPLKHVYTTTRTGKDLFHFDLKKILRGADSDYYVVRRNLLHRYICDKIDKSRVLLGAECTGFSLRDDGVLVHLKDGRSLAGDLLVAADGASSVIRRQIWGEFPKRYCGSSFRGIASRPAVDANTCREIHGRNGERVGICSMNDEYSYWWVAYNDKLNATMPQHQMKNAVLERFGDWPHELGSLVESTDDDIFYLNDMMDIKPLKHWGVGRVTLLGDAAHPTTPNLAQGACMAIEDGAVLSSLLSNLDDCEVALRAYEMSRIPRATKIVSTSFRWGRMCQWQSDFAGQVREALIGATPAFLGKQVFRELAFYDVKEAAAHALKNSNQFSPSKWEA